MRTRSRRRLFLEALEDRQVLSLLFVSPTGSDTAAGTITAPFKTIQRAVNVAQAGDTIDLRGGTYSNQIAIVSKPNITIQSYPGERASIVNPTTSTSLGNDIWFTATGGSVINLNITGGYSYGVKFDAGNGLVSCCKITGSGYYGVKVVPDADHVTIRDTEIAFTGKQTPGGAIDDVNGDYLTIQDCYLHDVPNEAITDKGGVIGSVIERNRIVNCGTQGILVGQISGAQYMDPVQNPQYYENIDATVRNNIIIGTKYAGIWISAALDPHIYNNTLINTAQIGQGSIFVTSASHSTSQGTLLTQTTNAEVVNNIITRSTASNLPMVFLTRTSTTGTLTFDHNDYYNAGSTPQFWDERDVSQAFYGTFSAWKARLGQEAGSFVANPLLTADGHLQAGSPDIGTGRTLTAVTDDIDRQTRTVPYSIGADQYVAPSPPPVTPFS